MLLNLLIKFVNLIIKSIGTLIQTLINILPPSPFEIIDITGIQEYIGALNWVFPINLFIVILEAWLVAIALYYVISVAMRWVKLIQ